MAGNKNTAISSQHSAVSPSKKTNRKTQTSKKSKPSTKARRRQWKNDDERVTTFPEVKGKVVRQVRFTRDEPNSVLAIAFKDRTVLYFQMDPEPLVLPLDVQAQLHQRPPQRGQELGGAWSIRRSENHDSWPITLIAVVAPTGADLGARRAVFPRQLVDFS